MSENRRAVKDRQSGFRERTATRIWAETPDPDNPYLARESRLYGYALPELVAHCRFPDVLYLLFRGELPAPEQAALLEALMIALINPGPRHPATRAAQNAGVGKTDNAHILPIALLVLGGEAEDANAVEPALRFLRQCQNEEPRVHLELPDFPPGFGQCFGSRHPEVADLASRLAALPGAGPALAFGERLALGLESRNAGWMLHGLAAAVFADLGFRPREAAGLYQLLRAPGLLAHGLELSNQPLTAMPFLPDSAYTIET